MSRNNTFYLEVPFDDTSDELPWEYINSIMKPAMEKARQEQLEKERAERSQYVARCHREFQKLIDDLK
jgi:hypothetical protein